MQPCNDDMQDWKDEIQDCMHLCCMQDLPGLLATSPDIFGRGLGTGQDLHMRISWEGLGDWSGRRQLNACLALCTSASLHFCTRFLL